MSVGLPQLDWCSLAASLNCWRAKKTKLFVTTMKMSAIITIITLLLHFNWNVAQVDSFPSSICVTWLLMEECIGGDRALTSTDVKFTYNYTVSGETRSRVGPVLTKNNEELKMYNLTYPDSSGGGGDTTRQAEYYFEQLEHGGGQCNCLNISINCATGNENRYKVGCISHMELHK